MIDCQGHLSAQILSFHCLTARLSFFAVPAHSGEEGGGRARFEGIKVGASRRDTVPLFATDKEL